MSPVTALWIEEDYFTAIATKLCLIGLDEDKIEDNTHRILDAWTFDGVLDTKSLDKIMEEWDDIDIIQKAVKDKEYSNWEKETLAYAPDYYTIENDYDDDMDVI